MSGWDFPHFNVSKTSIHLLGFTLRHQLMGNLYFDAP